MLKKCMLCPHECKVNREEGQIGRCRAGTLPKVALASLHNFEEPCISGINGSGTVFFSNCNLSCVFCQNYKISHEGIGKEISTEKLATIFLKEQEKQAHNINLVSPTIYVPQIIEALDIAKANGLSIPVIYNSSGYERAETIKKLNGYIDIYMPDFKYAEDDLGEKYSHIKNSMKVLEWIKQNIDDQAIISVMAQYFPTCNVSKTDLNRKLTKREYQKVEEYLYSLKLENGYIQELEENEEKYVPEFNLSNIE